MEPDLRSTCHKAPVYVEGSTTQYYVCTSCKRACVAELADDREGPPYYNKSCNNEANGVVDCDKNCDAKAKPETPEEYKAAYAHWRYHTWLSGCSHAKV